MTQKETEEKQELELERETVQMKWYQLLFECEHLWMEFENVKLSDLIATKVTFDQF